MSFGFDKLTLAIVAGLLVVLYQVIRSLRGRGAEDPDELWNGVEEGQRLRSLVESGLLGYMEVDVDGIVRRVNAAEEQIRGWPATKMSGRPFWELYPEAEQQRQRERFFRKMDDETVEAHQRRSILRTDGTKITVIAHEILLRDQSGHLAGMLTASLDISDRQRREEEAYTTKTELNALFGAFPDHFLRLDTSGNVIDSKDGRSRPFLLETSPLGRNIRDLFPQSAYNQLLEAISATNVKQTMTVLEYDLVRGGRTETYEARILPVGLDEVLAVMRDITARKRVADDLSRTAGELEQKNQELEEALYKAQESTKLKSRFLANVSHEIRTPMNGVIGMTEFLLSTPLNPEQREYAESVKSSAKSLLKILNDVLDISKIEAGKLQVERIPFHISETINEIAAVFALRARSKGLTFLSEPLPDLGCLTEGDPGRLRQVLNNLLGNALKFTPRGTVTLKTELIRQSGTEVVLRFSVIDTGIGISRDQQAKLFQNFVQGDNSMSRKYGGTGLGLAICRQLVGLMGGKIELRSQPGHGSAFSFTIPFGKKPLPRRAAPLAESLQGVRVLVVDRQKTGRPLAEQILSAWKVRAQLTSRGEEAVDALRRAAAGGQPFPLALIDLDLAELDGLRIAQTVKSDPLTANTLLVALTSSPMRGDGMRVHQAGYSGYLIKPFEPQDLRAMLEAVLRCGGQPGARLVTRHTVAEQAGERETQTPPPAPEEQAVQTAVAPPAGTGSAARKENVLRVLVAEDNLVNQKITARLLQKVGANVDVVANGREAVEAWEQTSYDLIMMDCQMPAMDGFEATARIRSQEQDDHRTPICAVTAHAMESDREKCLQAGMDDYISKPIDLQKLKEAVEKLTHKAETGIG